MNLKIDLTCEHSVKDNKNIHSTINTVEAEVFHRSDDNLVLKSFEKEAIQQSFSTSAKTYLLIWNPKRWSWTELPSLIEKKMAGSDVFRRWSCGNRRNIKKGDCVFIIRLGKPPKGIFANGTVVREPFEDDHWDIAKQRSGVKAHYVEIRIDTLINPEEKAIIPLDYLKRNFPNTLWTPQSSGTLINDEIAFELENQLKKQTI